VNYYAARFRNAISTSVRAILGVGSYRLAFRHPATRASSSEQNQRSPFDGVMIVSE
jgi:hypothetical protein